MSAGSDMGGYYWFAYKSEEAADLLQLLGRVRRCDVGTISNGLSISDFNGYY